ncbi:hypothetical protein AX17_004200 [Amanita inopinata Kibby_2008]|nr:hypothetical protein AX17_004200 [Amanita inopinata Kibby_2008]
MSRSCKKADDVGMEEEPSRFELPGFGLPYNYNSDEYSTLFASALGIRDLEKGYNGLPLTTHREFAMLHFMNQVTDDRNWHKQVFREENLVAWKTDLIKHGFENIAFSENMVEYCVKELQGKARIYKEIGAVSIYDADVVKSDIVISRDLRTALKNAAEALEDIPPAGQDWLTKHGAKCLELVHPSFFPLVYGRTRILPDSLTNLDDCIERCGEGVTIPVPVMSPKVKREYESPYKIGPNPFSLKFQWLPCEVDISRNNARITSYINNIHPQKYKGLYTIIARFIACAIPLWNVSLNPVKYQYHLYNRIIYRKVQYETVGAERNLEQREIGASSPATERPKGKENRDRSRRAVEAEPQDYRPPTTTNYLENELFGMHQDDFKSGKMVNLRRDYGHRGLQAVVKLESMHLTPEKPVYQGSPWQVDGRLNDHICATAVYVYDSLNVTAASIAFRQQVDVDAMDEMDHEHSDHQWFEDIFGCENGEPAVQCVGSVETREGRLITYPNTIQHKIESFRLADPTKSGHLSILIVHLVDPKIRIISTANVPCQRQDWWRDAFREKDSGMRKLPMELKDTVYDGLDFPISVKEAKAIRREMMKEWNKFSMAHNELYELVEFDLH